MNRVSTSQLEELGSQAVGVGGSWALQNISSSSVCLGSGVGTPRGGARHAWVVPRCLLHEDVGVGRGLPLRILE